MMIPIPSIIPVSENSEVIAVTQLLIYMHIHICLCITYIDICIYIYIYIYIHMGYTPLAKWDAHSKRDAPLLKKAPIQCESRISSI